MEEDDIGGNNHFWELFEKEERVEIKEPFNETNASLEESSEKERQMEIEDTQEKIKRVLQEYQKKQYQRNQNQKNPDLILTKQTQILGGQSKIIYEQTKILRQQADAYNEQVRILKKQTIFTEILTLGIVILVLSTFLDFLDFKYTRGLGLYNVMVTIVGIILILMLFFFIIRILIHLTKGAFD